MRRPFGLPQSALSLSLGALAAAAPRRRRIRRPSPACGRANALVTLVPVREAPATFLPISPRGLLPTVVNIATTQTLKPAAG